MTHKGSNSKATKPRPRLSRELAMELARKHLKRHQPKEYRLDVVDAERQPDGWWYVSIRPSRSGLKRYEYEGRLVEAMMDLREEEKANVVLLEESDVLSQA